MISFGIRTLCAYLGSWSRCVCTGVEFNKQEYPTKSDLRWFCWCSVTWVQRYLWNCNNQFRYQIANASPPAAHAGDPCWSEITATTTDYRYEPRIFVLSQFTGIIQRTNKISGLSWTSETWPCQVVSFSRVDISFQIFLVANRWIQNYVHRWMRL